MRGEGNQGCVCGDVREKVEVEKGCVCWAAATGGRSTRARPSQLKSERFCGKLRHKEHRSARASCSSPRGEARRARPARPPEGRPADAHADTRQRQLGRIGSRE